MRISVVCPVYNSESSIAKLADRLRPVLEEVAEVYELILVNDGSRDKSWAVVSELSDGHDWIHGVNLMRNFGQHNALLCGIRRARYEVIVTIDDDLQHPPEEIPKLLSRLDEGHDVVYGTPEHEQHGLWRDLASQVTKLALKSTMGVGVARDVGAFRAFRTQLREAFADYQSPLVSIDVLLTWGTTKFGSIPVRHDPREIGQSNYTFRKLVTHALNMMTGFTILPLQLASVLGLVSAGFGLALFVFTLARYFIQGVEVPGFTFLASAIALFSGIQLLTLGLIGEYLARVHLRTMNKPPYAVDCDLGDTTSPPEKATAAPGAWAERS